MIILERDGFRDGFISNFESGRLMTRFDFIEDESLSLRGNRRDNRWPSLVANDRSIQLLFWMITFPAEIKSAEICGDLWRRILYTPDTVTDQSPQRLIKRSLREIMKFLPTFSLTSFLLECTTQHQPNCSPQWLIG